ncbi:MAG: small multi-drug export protein [Steroidobacteraceae bacterium]
MLKNQFDAPRHLLLATAEGRILLAGLAGTLLLAVGIGLAWLVAPERAFTYIVMAGLNLSIGRAAGMSFGYASGLGHSQVIPINMLIETVQVIVVYPLFALTWTHLIDTPRWNALMGRMRAAATQHQGRVQRYGILGLFFFVFTPFWMTGPVVGAIIGFLIGLRPWVNLGVVLGATYIAIGVWALLLNELNRWLGAYNQLAPFALVMALILLALSGKLLRSPRNGQRPT